MSQPKVYEFAKEIGVETLALMDKIREWELPVKSHMAALDDETISEIKSRLKAEEAAKSGKKKKKATKKKKVAKKKTAKKTASSTSTDDKKVVRKKTKKIIRRKAATKQAQAEEEARKAEEAKQAAAEAAAQQAAEAEAAAAAPQSGPETESTQEGASQPAAAETVASGQTTETEGQPKVSASAETQATEQETTPKKRHRGNIVGRMDLRRVAPARSSSGPSSSSGGSSAPAAGARPRTGGQRSIRAGFIAPPPMESFDDQADQGRQKDKGAPVKKKPPGGGGGAAAKEQPAPSFTASEFRKREVIFQPKKKRVMTAREAKKTQITTPKAHKRVVKIYETAKVSELAQQMGLKAPQLIKVLIKNGIMANMNTELDFDTVSLISPEFGFEAQNLHKTVDDLIEATAFGDLEAEKISRPPVVTVMGHVDHGKTTLLDAIRNADVAAGEAGGITQHIGAYSVELEDGHKITFIDTPGHAAFTEMRARGANVTDVAIIVVAADDGMMPQTEEAVSHAKAAGVPIIVAVNKMDRPNANPDRIKQQLSEHGLLPEDWGGDTIFCEVSALQRQGVKELLEQIHVVAELQDIKANPKRSATGIVIESRVERGRGSVASVLVQEGTLGVGQSIVCGAVSGRVRSMMNERGQQVKEAGPGEPVEIMGLPDAPEAGDRFDVTKDEESARRIAEQRKERKQAEETPNSKMSLDQIFAKVKSGDVKELSVILKADVAGSIEAIKGMFTKINTDEVKVKVIHSAVGGISESDILLASTAGGLVIGFNVRPDTNAQRLAKEKSVEIKTYSIIYELADDIRKAMSGLLEPEYVERSMGAAEVREIFSVPRIGTIAGCSVTNGMIARNHNVRLVRDGRVVYTGKISSLKRFKDDVKEVQSGYECGIGIENYNDLKVGDVIESFIEEAIAREL